jgi:hypothetical protein
MVILASLPLLLLVRVPRREPAAAAAVAPAADD